MIRDVYLVLGGEGQDNARTRKLIEILSIKKNFEQTRIILSGYAYFNRKPQKTEAQIMKDVLLKNNIPEQCILLEEKSFDTLGNFVFSRMLAQRLVADNRDNDMTITLITEGFHMRRSKELFNKIFSSLKIINPKLKLDIIPASTSGISKYFWKRKAQVIAEKIKRKYLNNKTYDIQDDLKEYFDASTNIALKYSRDAIITFEIIFDDIFIFNINTFVDFEEYLFSLPYYHEAYAKDKPVKYPQTIYGNVLRRYFK